MTQIPVRGRGTLTCRTFEMPGGFILRLDDDDRPDFWCEIDLTADQLRRLLDRIDPPAAAKLTTPDEDFQMQAEPGEPGGVATCVDCGYPTTHWRADLDLCEQCAADYDAIERLLDEVDAIRVNGKPARRPG